MPDSLPRLAVATLLMLLGACSGTSHVDHRAPDAPPTPEDIPSISPERAVALD
ncbi:MAG: hypothetical protein AAF809_12245 [Bacteroidota bacterium]